MALQFERGIDALKQTNKGGGGGLGAFTPNIRWEDGETKYIAILNPVDEIPRIYVHEFIPVGERKAADGTTKPIYAEFLDRTSGAVGEDVDPLTEKGSEARERNIAVGVELEPILGKGRGGRPRPKGFEVKTVDFKRRIFDEDGEDTGEREEVTAPVIGFIMQSAFNFFGYLGSFNEEDGPHEDVPFRITRRGGSKQTAYDWTPFLEQELDLSNVVDYVDGISYLRPHLDDLREGLNDLDEADGAHFIASRMLDIRLEELGDPERYEKLTGEIEEIVPKFGGKKKQSEKKDRPSQASRRRKSEPEEPGDEPDSNEDNSDADEDEKKLNEFERLRAKSKRNK